LPRFWLSSEPAADLGKVIVVTLLVITRVEIIGVVVTLLATPTGEITSDIVVANLCLSDWNGDS